MKFASLEKLEAYVGVLNKKSFFAATEVGYLKNINVDLGKWHLCSNKLKDLSNAQQKINVSPIESTYDFSKHFNSYAGLVKVNKLQYSFYVIHNNDEYCKIFVPDSYEFIGSAVVAISHKFKQIGHFYAFEKDDGKIIVSNAFSSTFSGFAKCMSWSFNKMYSRYHGMFGWPAHNIGIVEGIYATIDDYFAFQEEHNKLKYLGVIDDCSNVISLNIEKIDKIKDENDEYLEIINKCKNSINNFSETIFKAKVDSDLMGINDA